MSNGGNGKREYKRDGQRSHVGAHLEIRRVKMFLDADLAELHNVSTKRVESADKAQPAKVSTGFYVSTHRGRKSRGGHNL